MRVSKTTAGFLALAAMLIALAAVFQWNWLRGPIGEAISEKTGRRFEIAGDMDVRLRRTLQITLNDVRFENAEWSDTPRMADVRKGTLALRYGPLLRGKLVFAEVALDGAEVSLERTADHKRNWILAKSTDHQAEPPEIEKISLRDSRIRYRDAPFDIDMKAEVTTDNDQPEYPTRIAFQGKYRKAEVKGTARTGPVLTLQDSNAAFRAEAEARFGTTVAKFDGTLSDLKQGGAIDADLAVNGSDLSKLFPILPVVLPETPPFRFKGRFKRNGDLFRYENFEGVIGRSDIRGSASFTKQEPRPMLKATLESRILDLADLGPLIGLRSEQTTPKASKEKKPADRSVPPRKILPDKPFNLSRMNAMDADVTLAAKRIDRPNEVPLDDMRTHVVLNAGTLKLDPLEFGFSGGRIAAKIDLDGTQQPILAKAEINLRKVKLQDLFPTIELMRSSFGTIGAQIKLTGRGNSIAAMLGNADGEAGFAMAGGELSALLLEAVDLNGVGIVKYLAFGDKTLPNRCSVAAFDIKDGFATTRLMVFDTAISNIQGEGGVSLKQEALDLKLNPRPKNKSVFVARTPIRLHGPFSRLDWDLEKGPLLARGGAALALGALNPLASLLALLETGPGKDADCNALMAEVTGAQQQAEKSAKPSALPKPEPAPATQ